MLKTSLSLLASFEQHFENIAVAQSTQFNAAHSQAISSRVPLAETMASLFSLLPEEGPFWTNNRWLSRCNFPAALSPMTV